MCTSYTACSACTRTNKNFQDCISNDPIGEILYLSLIPTNFPQLFRIVLISEASGYSEQQPTERIHDTQQYRSKKKKPVDVCWTVRHLANPLAIGKTGTKQHCYASHWRRMCYKYTRLRVALHLWPELALWWTNSIA